jgi:hypothetical protein
VDAFVYHKHCRFCCCTMAPTMQLEHCQRMVVKVGTTPPTISCNWKIPHGLAFDREQRTIRRRPRLSFSLLLILSFK